MPVTKVTPTPIEITSGNARLITVTVLDQDDAVVNLTGASVQMKIARSKFDSAIVTKAGVITDAANGILTVDLLGADTAALSGVYYYEINVTDVGGRESTVAYGDLTVIADIP